MDETKINQTGKNKPEKRFTAGAVTATVWKNERSFEGKETEFLSVSLQRSYKDKEDNWQHTNNLRVNDLPKAVLVLQKAYEYILMKNNEE